MIDLAAIDTALTSALPILAATAIPALAILAAVFTAEWHRLGQPDDDYTIDDYRPAAAVRVRTHRPVDAPTQVIPRVLPDAGTPLYDQLSARHTAKQWLAELAASVNTVNTRSVR